MAFISCFLAFYYFFEASALLKVFKDQEFLLASETINDSSSSRTGAVCIEYAIDTASTTKRITSVVPNINDYCLCN
jgi:hypothetical protein